MNLASIQKLIQFNKKTKIVSRPTILDYAGWSKENTAPPDADSISRMFRTEGVQLTTLACKEAMREACLEPSDITHTVAVTCTDQSNPGYDLFVCQELGLGPNVQRVLLHGVGCAGGLSALRAAASIAAAASQRGRPARVLVMACEICSLSIQAEVQAAREDGKLHVAPALFSDGAAALAVCNGLALEDKQKPVFELQDWDSVVVPGTSSYISYDIEKHGTAIDAILPLFDRLRTALNTTHAAALATRNPASNFDWAIHPGGATILQGAKQALQLNDDHIRASLDVYHNYGNSSSPTVLIVLDKLRRMGEGRENIVATSFGPGRTYEDVYSMAFSTLTVVKEVDPGTAEGHERYQEKDERRYSENAEAVPRVLSDDDVREPDDQLATPSSASFQDRLKKFQYTETQTDQRTGLTSRSPIEPRKRSRTTVTAVAKIAPEPSPRPKKKRKPSKYADPSKYAHLSPLVDILEPNLICIFVGTNPGVQTAAAGHAYAHPSNLFWKLLHSSGLTDRRLKPEEDRSLPALYCMGNTNIVERPSKDAAELSKEETAAGTAQLDAKFLKYKPEAVCIVGKGIWEAIWRYRYGKNMGKKDFKYGWQDEEHNMGKSEDGQEEQDVDGNVWNGSRVFVTTSTSGLAASLKPAEKEAIWKPFGEWVQKRRAERGFVPRPAEA
ncbi:uncharacterized protein J4E87_002663 [Alternaria ethzedia]|uniref:uncharacterized protein n=1 Tax=Alternaria ethzedia TaxID=181014 RepID=UPI0020C5A311|nr:uncharacterized protein J4E87_002663 [Alternaria ethzedia]KAI4631956.1 hypothetical protein J4E87_002663 [Alternaria ethzedia]